MLEQVRRIRVDGHVLPEHDAESRSSWARENPVYEGPGDEVLSSHYVYVARWR